TGLRHLYRAEKEVFDALVSMAENARSSQLNTLFLHHREETSTQMERLERIFSLLDIDIKRSQLRGMNNLTNKRKEILKTLIDWNFTDRSKGMEGILSEGKELMRHFNDTDAGDFGLMSAGGKVEHFEIGCYTPLCILAEKLGEKKV